jgi:cell division protein FtsL
MKRRKIKMKFVFFCSITIALVVFICIFTEQQRLLNIKKTELSKIELSINKENKINKRLKKESKQVNSDKFIERIARSKLGMVRPGEIVYIDINNNN